MMIGAIKFLNLLSGKQLLNKNFSALARCNLVGRNSTTTASFIYLLAHRRRRKIHPNPTNLRSSFVSCTQRLYTRTTHTRKCHIYQSTFSVSIFHLISGGSHMQNTTRQCCVECHYFSSMHIQACLHPLTCRVKRIRNHPGNSKVQCYHERHPQSQQKHPNP